MVLGSVRFGTLPPVFGLLGSFLGCPVKPEAKPDWMPPQVALRRAARRSDAGRVQRLFTGARCAPATPQRRQMTHEFANVRVRVRVGTPTQHLTALYTYYIFIFIYLYIPASIIYLFIYLFI
jgi:hypothetical protein